MKKKFEDECNIAQTFTDAQLADIVRLRTQEKEYQKTGNINAGVYVLNKAILTKSILPLKFSFEKDFMEAFVQDYAFYGRISKNYFIDIGIPTDYAQAQIDLK